MKTTNIISKLLIAILLCSNIFTYCNLHQKSENPVTENTLTDTIFLSQWRKEKAEKLKLIDGYNFRLQQLAQTKDSLNFSLAISKNLMTSYRLRSNDLAEQLRGEVGMAHSDSMLHPQIKTLIDSVIIYKYKADSACDESIANLESGILNRDSTIRVFTQITRQWQEIQKEQELQNQALTTNLKTALKQQKRKSRQNKILAGGLILLSGITTAILISPKN